MVRPHGAQAKAHSVPVFDGICISVTRHMGPKLPVSKSSQGLSLPAATVADRKLDSEAKNLSNRYTVKSKPKIAPKSRAITNPFKPISFSEQLLSNCDER